MSFSPFIIAIKALISADASVSVISHGARQRSIYSSYNCTSLTSTFADLNMSRSFSSELGNSSIAEQHYCPNPRCNLIFSSIDDVCAHLSVPGLACTDWTEEFIHNLRQRENVEDESEDGE